VYLTCFVGFVDPTWELLALCKFPRGGPRGVGQSVTECVVKPLRDVKVTGLKPAGTKNPTMLRVGVAQAGCDPRVILTA
jgi:hypothetical protein